MFKIRKQKEVRKNDEPILQLTVGDDASLLYKEWCSYGGNAHLFMVEGSSNLYARGNKFERTLATGFVLGWRRRSRVVVE